MTGDRIEVRGLRLVGVHGLLPEERGRPQPFEIDLDVEVDMAPVAASGVLSDTADYGAVLDRTGGGGRGPARTARIPGRGHRRGRPRVTPG